MENQQSFPIEIIGFKSNFFKEEETKREMRLHKHATLEISYIVEGELILEYEDKKTGTLKKRTLYSKDFFIISPNCLHRTSIPHSLKTLGVELIIRDDNILHYISTSKWVNSLPYAEKFFLSFDDVKFLRDKHNVRYLLNDLKKYLPSIQETEKSTNKNDISFENTKNNALANEFVPFLYKLDLQKLLIEILRCSVNEETKTGKTVHVIRAISYINSNYADNLSVENIAKAIHISEVYLQKMFRKQTGSSVHEYINKVRIKKAKNYIIHTNYSFLKISKMIGYHSVQAFIFNFKKQVGMTPLAYKNKEQHNVDLEFFIGSPNYQEHVF